MKKKLIILSLMLIASCCYGKLGMLAKLASTEYYHVFPFIDKYPYEGERTCTGLDALHPDCLNIEIQKGEKNEENNSDNNN